jgi:glycosyltransferase involved in cell wall biosynthesis
LPQKKRRDTKLSIAVPRTLVIIPTLNEESTIYQVAKSFLDVRKDIPLEVLVIDGHSADKTVEMAKGAGAKVVIQRSSGKGMAMVEAVEKSADFDVCIFIDGDGTYLPCEFECIAEPVQRGEADMVVGSRINGKMEKGAILPVNMIGNMLCNLIVRAIFRTPLHDVLSGYRAIRTDAFAELGLKGRHFEIEVEMTVKALAKELKVIEVPITYMRRRGKPTKLLPFRDGVLIFTALISEILRR